MKDTPDTATDALPQDVIDRYRRDGFVVIEDMFDAGQIAALRARVEEAVSAEDTPRADAELSTYDRIFTQKVNLWTRHRAVAETTLDPRLGRMAAALEGRPMRVWHDQALFKKPGLADNRTPWHQDAVYWPHRDRWHQTTAWIALTDATPDNGCMSFLPGTQALGPLDPVALDDPADIFGQRPHLRDAAPVQCPLRAGSVTFHNGLTWHYAGANTSDAVREAYAVIFMPDGTVYTGDPHVVTDDRALTPGAPLGGDLFPLVG